MEGERQCAQEVAGGISRKFLAPGIVHRTKRGFTLPFEPWMRGELRREVEPVLTTGIGNGPLDGILDAAAVRKVWEDFLLGTTSWTRPWSLYVLHRWCELHL